MGGEDRISQVGLPTENGMPELEGRKTVLLVEDNEDNCIVYATMLQYHGYHVLTTGDGIEALRLTREELPDIVLMDVSIPGLDGWAVTERLKHDPVTAHIPIVAVTAHALPSDREKAWSVGCDGYLAKPCEPRRLLEEVERVTGREAGHAAE